MDDEPPPQAPRTNNHPQLPVKKDLHAAANKLAASAAGGYGNGAANGAPEGPGVIMWSFKMIRT